MAQASYTVTKANLMTHMNYLINTLQLSEIAEAMIGNRFLTNEQYRDLAARNITETQRMTEFLYIVFNKLRFPGTQFCIALERSGYSQVVDVLKNRVPDPLQLKRETPIGAVSSSLPNVSARQRRREQTTASQERPQSARQVRLKRPEVQKLKTTRSEYGPISSKQSTGKKRQPSIQDDSSSSEDDTLKEYGDFKRDKEKHRENKEMNNFISLLDTTLHVNKEDEKSNEDAEKVVVQVEEIEVPENNGAVHRSASLPSVEMLCSANRLMSRIQIIHKDCVNGVGFDTLHKAYQILSNIEDDEVEPQLVQLMGKDKFDLYAGKIWQLKFCEECFEQLPQLQS